MYLFGLKSSGLTPAHPRLLFLSVTYISASSLKTKSKDFLLNQLWIRLPHLSLLCLCPFLIFHWDTESW